MFAKDSNNTSPILLGLILFFLTSIAILHGQNIDSDQNQIEHPDYGSFANDDSILIRLPVLNNSNKLTVNCGLVNPGGKNHGVDWLFFGDNNGDNNGDIKVDGICSNNHAFAGITQKGDLILQGDPFSGGSLDKRDSLDTFSLDRSNNQSIIASGYKNFFGVKKIFSSKNSFLAILENETVISWGAFDTDPEGNHGYIFRHLRDSLLQTPIILNPPELGTKVKDVVSNKNAYAILMEDGSIFQWGTTNYGGKGITEKGYRESNETSKATKLNLPRGRYALLVVPCYSGFVAILDDHSLFSWGIFLTSWCYPDNWGKWASYEWNFVRNHYLKASLDEAMLQPTVDQGTQHLLPPQYQDYRIIEMHSNYSAVTIWLQKEKEKGEKEDVLLCWGARLFGGTRGTYNKTRNVFRQIKLRPGEHILKLYNNSSTFTALLSNGEALCWGETISGGGRLTNSYRVNPRGPKIQKIIPNPASYTAILENRELLCWGYENDGGKTPTYNNGTSIKNVKEVVSTDFGFMARTDQNELILWGTKWTNTSYGPEMKPLEPVIIAAKKPIHSILSTRFYSIVLDDDPLGNMTFYSNGETYGSLYTYISPDNIEVIHLNSNMR